MSICYKPSLASLHCHRIPFAKQHDADPVVPCRHTQFVLLAALAGPQFPSGWVVAHLHSVALTVLEGFIFVIDRRIGVGEHPSCSLEQVAAVSRILPVDAAIERSLDIGEADSHTH